MATLTPSSGYSSIHLQNMSSPKWTKIQVEQRSKNDTWEKRYIIRAKQGHFAWHWDLPHTANRWGFTMHMCIVTLPLLLKTAVNREREIRVRA